MKDRDGFEWGERNDPIDHVILFTNRSIMVFNTDNLQIPFYQQTVSCYRINKVIAQEIANKARRFSISNWRGWINPITKKEFEYLMGLRSKKRDLLELD
jgi:hypothetical protein